MQYAKLNEDGTYSHQITTYGNIQWDENNYCSAESLVKDGKAHLFRIVELYETDPPAINPKTQSVIRDGGECVDGRWRYKWRIDDLTKEQININRQQKENAIRQERNRRLAETDWRFRSDMNPSQDWVDYCRALRDVPQQQGFPFNVVWPTKPE